MKKRWKLLKSGVDQKDIKVRGSGIYRTMQLHGELDTKNWYIRVEQRLSPESKVDNFAQN